VSSSADGAFWLGDDPGDLGQAYARCWIESGKNLLKKAVILVPKHII
jgi:hypothetical protein